LTETPSLDYLLRAYFHQDWPDLEGPTTGAVLERFAQENIPEEIASARNEAAGLLMRAASDDELASELRSRKLNYLPEANGLTYRQWLEGLVEHLDDLASRASQ
jgi:hypothetical protein